MKLTVLDRRITVFESGKAAAPIVYLNGENGEGATVWKACQSVGCHPFTLVEISGLRWDHDLSPWEAPSISPGGAPFTGGAGEFLRLLTEEIVPAVEDRLSKKPAVRGLAGYSLAGLFALYAAYQTDLFPRIASISGSLWFPGFLEYVLSHEMKATPSHLYLSLGDREARTRNPIMRTVQENTERIAAHFHEQGLHTAFELNPGNHFQHADERTAAGIRWLLSEGSQAEANSISR